MPGQPVHEATRKVVLAGADGVVFVADSSPAAIEPNRDVVDEPQTANLARASRSKRSRSSSSTTSATFRMRCRSPQLDRFGDPTRPIIEAQAKAGIGVVPTFFELVAAPGTT